MNSSPGPVVGMIGRLSTGVSKFSIRWAYGRPRYRKPKYHLTGFKEGLGELIYVFNHTENGMIIYSHDKELRRDSKKHLDQIPITAKKMKPPVLRKDYWEPLCLIRFDKGQGEIGRNVFQKLQEYRRLHELSWGWQTKDLIKMNKWDRAKTLINQKRNAIADMAAVLAGAGKGNKMWTTEPEPKPEPEAEPAEEGAEKLKPVSEEAIPEGEAVKGTVATEASPAATGQAVTEQAVTEPVTATSTVTETKPAETPAVPEEMTAKASTEQGSTSAAEELAKAPAGEEAAAAAAAAAAAKAKAEAKKKPKGPQKRLLKATVYWANDADVNWAKKWTPNVDHQIGLPDDVSVPRWETRYFHLAEPDEAPAEEVKEGQEGEGNAGEGKEGEGKEGEGKDGEAKVEKTELPEAKPEEAPKPAKRSILGSLFGRKSSS